MDAPTPRPGQGPPTATTDAGADYAARYRALGGPELDLRAAARRLAQLSPITDEQHAQAREWLDAA